MAVGGIRISHMSDITAPVSMALTATRGSKKVFTVKPLKAQTTPPPQGEGPALITLDQRKEIVAEMGEQVKPSELLAHFAIKSTSEILASQLPDVLAWVQKQKEPQGEACPECLQTEGHGEQCPFWEPPPDDDQPSLI
jgi:hypothetical protein